jgi:Flp pilus assembly protein TadG
MLIADMQCKGSRAIKRLLGCATMRKLIRQKEGSASVEFGLIAAPFLAMIFAIMETAVVFFAGQALETAAADSSRLIMTGQAQSSGYTAAQFKTAVCGKIYGLFNCASGLYVDVKTYTNFSNINNATLPVDSSGNLQTGNFGYQPGGPGDIVVVRLMYQWPVYVSLLGLNLTDMSGGKRLLMSTVSFRNEPYQ